MQLKSLKEANFKGKNVILRVGFDCPVSNGKVDDSFRIDRGLESFRYVLTAGAKKIIVISKLGRPGGVYQAKDTLKPIFSKFKMKGKDFGYDGEMSLIDYKENIDEVIDAALADKNQIVFLENIRFWAKGDEENMEFAKKISRLGEVYVNDCFNVSHRMHPTITGITHFLPSYAGLLLMEEVDAIEKVMKNPKRPAIAIVGGAKLETKVPIIKELVKKYDQILVGGLIAVEIMNNIRDFDNMLSLEDREKVVLPLGFSDVKQRDISDETAEKYAEIIRNAKTILWNGPMGKFEEKPFDKGSQIVASAVAESDAYKLAGGGETSEMLKALGVFEKVDFISTGGGAMLDFIAGQNLPGVEVLKKEQ